VALEDDRGCDDGEMALSVGPPDAPGGQEGDRQEGEVDEQRERVAVDEQDADGVQQLGVLRVEPVGEDRVDVVQPGHGMALDHVGGEGEVVPERVEVEDPAVEGVLCGYDPVGEDEGDYAPGDEQGQPLRAGRSCRGRGPTTTCGS
jgi:hypothetical protein